MRQALWYWPITEMLCGGGGEATALVDESMVEGLCAHMQAVRQLKTQLALWCSVLSAAGLGMAQLLRSWMALKC